MRNRWLRPAAVTAAGFFFSTFFAVTLAFADAKSDLQSSVNAAKDQYETASSALEEIQNQQTQTESQVAALQGQTDAVRAQLTQVYNALQAAQTELDAAQAAAEDAAAALAAKQAEYDARYQTCKEQLVAMQKLHDGGSIALLSQATNLYEVLTFAKTLEQISSKNSELLAALDAEAAALDAQRQAAEDAAAAAQTAKDALTAQQNELDNTAAQLTDALMAADSALTEQQAAAEAQEAVTDEAKAAYDKANRELDAYVRAQSQKYSAPDLHCSVDFGCPLPSVSRISCHFGEPDAYYGKPHTGTDLPAAAGTVIYAVADGVVSVATTHFSYGNYVQISHGTADNGNRYDSLYAHMTSYCVSAGQSVAKGQVIGYVGNTGDSKGNHLHLELRINGSRINAEQWIPLG